MIIDGRMLKEKEPKCKVVFIGPCTAKKEESARADFQGIIDYAISFEEMRAMFDAHDIDLTELEGEKIVNGSHFGRVFARSGGVTSAIEQAIKEYDMKVDLKPVICSGITECEKALKLAKLGKLNCNFIEGMACEGGCINGPLSLCHKPKNKNDIDRYGEQSTQKNNPRGCRLLQNRIVENNKIETNDSERNQGSEVRWLYLAIFFSFL